MSDTTKQIDRQALLVLAADAGFSVVGYSFVMPTHSGHITEEIEKFAELLAARATPVSPAQSDPVFVNQLQEAIFAARSIDGREDYWNDVLARLGVTAPAKPHSDLNSAALEFLGCVNALPVDTDEATSAVLTAFDRARSRLQKALAAAELVAAAQSDIVERQAYEAMKAERDRYRQALDAGAQSECVEAICDAYESGMGHGLQRDGHKSGAAFANPECGKAYELGYEAGEERASVGAQVAKCACGHTEHECTDTADGKPLCSAPVPAPATVSITPNGTDAIRVASRLQSFADRLCNNTSLGEKYEGDETELRTAINMLRHFARATQAERQPQPAAQAAEGNCTVCSGNNVFCNHCDGMGIEPRKIIGYGDCKCILTQYCDGKCNPIWADAAPAAVPQGVEAQAPAQPSAAPVLEADLLALREDVAKLYQSAMAITSQAAQEFAQRVVEHVRRTHGVAPAQPSAEQVRNEVLEEAATICDSADKSTHPADLADRIRAKRTTASSEQSAGGFGGGARNSDGSFVISTGGGGARNSDGSFVISAAGGGVPGARGAGGEKGADRG